MVEPLQSLSFLPLGSEHDRYQQYRINGAYDGYEKHPEPNRLPCANVMYCAHQRSLCLRHPAPDAEAWLNHHKVLG